MISFNIMYKALLEASVWGEAGSIARKALYSGTLTGKTGAFQVVVSFWSEPKPANKMWLILKLVIVVRVLALTIDWSLFLELATDSVTIIQIPSLQSGTLGKLIQGVYWLLGSNFLMSMRWYNTLWSLLDDNAQYPRLRPLIRLIAWYFRVICSFDRECLAEMKTFCTCVFCTRIFLYKKFTPSLYILFIN